LITFSPSPVFSSTCFLFHVVETPSHIPPDFGSSLNGFSPKFMQAMVPSFLSCFDARLPDFTFYIGRRFFNDSFAVAFFGPRLLSDPWYENLLLPVPRELTCAFSSFVSPSRESLFYDEEFLPRILLTMSSWSGTPHLCVRLGFRIFPFSWNALTLAPLSPPPILPFAGSLLVGTVLRTSFCPVSVRYRTLVLVFSTYVSDHLFIPPPQHRPCLVALFFP